ncbi:MAG: hypothetical protein IIB03_07300 [Acidobacteria bacterium]|nr:hypothetical protein [Acidobacteriota bacterium]
MAVVIALGIRAVNKINRHDDSPEPSPRLVAIIADMLRSALEWESTRASLEVSISDGSVERISVVSYAPQRRKRPKSLD